MIDQDTFERIAAQLAGHEPSPLAQALSPFPSPSHRCSTLDGNPVEVTEAVAAALIGHIRRVVIGADSVVIDMGRKRRLFTGPAALAVKLSNTTCFRPGCQVPVTDCQSDHLRPWSTRADGSGGGCTCPGNGGLWSCRLRETQPDQGTRLHGPPRPHRHLARHPPRRHQDHMTRRVHTWPRVTPVHVASVGEPSAERLR
ncbi:MAG: hypothetical protein ACR2JF_15775 [Iamia sp.]